MLERRGVMKETFEKIWVEYFSDECAKIETDEEKALIKKAAEMHKAIDELMMNEQISVMEEYVDTLYQIQWCFVRKSFFKGCKFALSFILETEK